MAGSCAGSMQAMVEFIRSTRRRNISRATRGRHRWFICAAVRRCDVICNPDLKMERRLCSGDAITTRREYLAGYSGPPPMVHLRRGETLRRYLQPGLEDGKTFVFWGRNNNTKGISRGLLGAATDGSSAPR